jgi:hypothetical protein
MTRPKWFPLLGIAVLSFGVFFLIVNILKTLTLLALAGIAVLMVGGVFLAARKLMR